MVISKKFFSTNFILKKKSKSQWSADLLSAVPELHRLGGCELCSGGWAKMNIWKIKSKIFQNWSNKLLLTSSRLFDDNRLIYSLSAYLVDLLQFFCYLFYKRSICIIDNGASRRRTRNARFRARHADHSTTFEYLLESILLNRSESSLSRPGHAQSNELNYKTIYLWYKTSKLL